MKHPRLKYLAGGLIAAALAIAAVPSHAETLRLLTWGSYAPQQVIDLFEKKYPDINVQVTFSNNEDMIAKLRATGGAGYDLVQPSHDRIYGAQEQFNIYKPMDLSKIDTSVFEPKLLDAVKANTTIDGKVYAVPDQWGTSGLLVNKAKAPDVKRWGDLCDAKYKGHTSMRLKRTILLGMAFDMGMDPFALYGDKAKYQDMLDKVTAKLIACKSIVKTYWKGGDDLAALMLSGEVYVSDSWDSTAYKLYSQNHDIVFVPPETGALAWIDTFALPRRGEADDAAYKWINFVLQPDIVPMMSAQSGAAIAVKNGISMMPADKRAAAEAAFTQKDIDNLKFFANIPPGIEELEGKALDKINAASSE